MQVPCTVYCQENTSPTRRQHVSIHKIQILIWTCTKLYELIDTIHLNVPDFSDVLRINPRTSLENGKHISHSAAEIDQTPPGTHPF